MPLRVRDARGASAIPRCARAHVSRATVSLSQLFCEVTNDLPYVTKGSYLIVMPENENLCELGNFLHYNGMIMDL